jgi:CheY-like chemotaxis protein
MARILVVQDVPANIVDLKMSLEPRGHELFVAESIESAKTLLRASLFDMVICGVHLENGTVFDLLKYVKENPDRRMMPFIFFCCSPKEIARYVSDTVRSTAFLLGADKYITQETFDAPGLCREIESMLSERSNSAVKASRKIPPV